jgi:hypothetical protein
VLASLVAVPGGGITVDATNVYFTVGCSSSVGGMTCSGSNVLKVPKSGGAPVTLAPGVGAVAIAADSTDVYWVDAFTAQGGPGPSTLCGPGASCPSNTSGNDVRKVALDGGPFTILAAGQGARLGLGVQAGNLYWTNQVCPGGVPSACMAALMTIAGANGAPTSLVTVAGDVFGPLAADATGVAYVDNNDVMRVALDGGSPTLLAPGPALSVATDGTDVYFTTSSAVMKVPAAGGSPVTLASIPHGPTTPSSGVPSGLAVDGDNVYWTGYGCGDAGCLVATVNRVPRAGGAVTTVALNPNSAGAGGGLALDETHVYWLDFSCAIGPSTLCVMSMPK